MINQPKLIINNLTLKVLALLLGYGLWLALAHHQPTKLELIIPVLFGELVAPFQITAPQTITATIFGKRADLQKLHVSSLGAYLNLSELKQAGSYQVHISPKQIFLPSNIKLLDYSPVLVDIQLNN
jgi:hypothetical protein